MHTLSPSAPSITSPACRTSCAPATGLLLAAASIVASFLGAQALRGSDLDALAGLGLLAFLVVLGLSISILMPP